MSSNNFEGICKAGHSITSLDDTYKYKRKDGTLYLRCKVCMRDKQRRSRRKIITDSSNLPSALKDKMAAQASYLSKHDALVTELERAMPWEREGIRKKIKELNDAVM